MVIKISIPKMESKCVGVSKLLKALSHPKRLLIMGHLASGAKTVSELVNECGMSQSQLSQSLTRMKLENLVSCERRGKFQYYSICDRHLIDLVKAIHSIFCG